MIKRVDVKDMYSLSPMQEGMLFHYMMDKKSNAYFEQLCYRVIGDINHKLLEQAFNQLIDRYDILRTIFVYEKIQSPLQVVLKKRKASVYYEDISRLNEDEKVSRIKDFRNKDKKRGFDLSKDLPIRFSIVRIADKTYEIIWSFHHIVIDGWCTKILIKEMLSIYCSLNEGKTVTLPEVKPYSLYIKWLEKQDKEKGLNYWRKYLEAFENQSGFPKFEEGKEGKFEQEEFQFKINKALTGKLDRVSNRNEVTLNTTFQTLWGILLQKYNNTGDVVFGSVVASRPAELPGIETMIGLFINTIPIRIQSEHDQRFTTLLKRVQEEINHSKNYDYLPLAEIQANSPLKGDLLSHITVFENYPLEKDLEQLSEKNEFGFSVQTVEVYTQTNYDITVIVSPQEELTVKIKYNSIIYEGAIIKRIEDHLNRIIKQVTTDGGIRMKEIEIPTGLEKNQLLFEFNNTGAEYSKDKTIHELFEDQVDKTPDNITVVAQRAARSPYSVMEHHASCSMRHAISYRELNKKANQLARILRNRAVEPDTVVGIIVEPFLEMITGIIAILKAGGLYLPIDPDQPEERITYMLNDSKAKLLLTQKYLSSKVIFAGESVNIENNNLYKGDGSNLRNVNTPVHLVYSIYTSGTTGKSRGVLLENKNLVNYVSWFKQKVDLTKEDSSVLTSSFGFDLGYTSIFPTILTGSQLHIIQKETYLSAEGLINYISKNEITYVKVTPSLFRVIVESSYFMLEMLRKLRLVVLGGEEIKLKDVEKAHAICPHIQIMNHYGPTEATIGSIAQLIDFDRFEEYIKRPTIGNPIKNSTVCILDRNLKLLPPGVAGELCLGGDNTARGYLNNPGLTAEKFIENPFQPPLINTPLLLTNDQWPMINRLYRTGDLARWTTHGTLEFLGRIDHQVKIRGYRIELGEIESRLLDNDNVDEAVVVARKNENGDNYLCAYIVDQLGDEKTATALELKLKEYLAKRLPAYMIPSYFVNLGKMPLTPNGKVDRKRLPEAERMKNGLESQSPSPRNEMEEKLVELWAEVLGIDKGSISIDADFFVLGGHSLKAMQLISRIHKELSVEIPLKEIFNRLTIYEISRYLSGKKGKRYSSIEPVEKKDYYVLSSAQKRLYVWQQMDTGNVAYNIPLIAVLEGRVETEKLQAIFRKLIDRHESLRTSFEMNVGEPVQRVHDKVDFALQFYNISNEKISAPQEGISDEYVQELVKNFVKPFDLARAPLIRVGLIKEEKERYIVIADKHHIIADGVSNRILERDFMALYGGEELPGLSIQYKDYSQWQNNFLMSENMKKQEEYWLKIFENWVPMSNIPYDYEDTDNTIHSYAEGSSVNFEIDREDTTALIELALKEEVTLYMVLLAVYYILLFKISQQGDILVVSPVAGRRHAALEPIMGLFVNPLVLRNFPERKKTFRYFLRDVRERTLNSFENQEYPVDLLMANIAGFRESKFAFFILQNMDFNELIIPDLKLSTYEHISRPLKTEISLEGFQSEDRMHFSFRYSTKHFKRETIQRLINYFKEIVTVILKKNDIKLEEISLGHGLVSLKPDIPEINFGF
ncbi:MAG: amino acid adenylation domain-containing protein [Candidatus Aminicenantes bacterium]|jgi:amino acid adenylation domain-containing protein